MALKFRMYYGKQRCTSMLAWRNTQLRSLRAMELGKDEWRRSSRRYCQQTTQALPSAKGSVTSWFAEMISQASLSSLSPTAVRRSKRMVLDTLGVGILGSGTETCRTVRRWGHSLGCLELSASRNSLRGSVWGSKGESAPAPMAAFLNGVSVHAMDFDDTWHPATHPSGPVLPAVLALAESPAHVSHLTTDQLLVAYNVGLQAQGLLLRCSSEAAEIPKRFHPPAVVGVMGAAAASCRLLDLGPTKTRHALAIAASFAGAPLANAGTMTKPLHAGKAARSGVEAALLADQGMEGSEEILDAPSGFAAFYDDYSPEDLMVRHGDDREVVLHHQDVAIKRFPAHLGAHWAIDAALALRRKMRLLRRHPEHISSIEIVAPNSSYINRPSPSSEHEARHSFQFGVCTAILDGDLLGPDSFHAAARHRPQLRDLLGKTSVLTPGNIIPSFDAMYVDVTVALGDGTVFRSHCDTPYGHWRNPLSDDDVERKFLNNARCLPDGAAADIITMVKNLDSPIPATELVRSLRY